MPRFSKNTLAEYVSNRLTTLEARHGFDRKDGYGQVQGLGDELNRLYGEYNHLRDLADEFELHIPSQALPIPRKVRLLNG